MPALTGDMLFEVVRRKSATDGSLDGWGWRELKVLPVAWFDGLARILAKVEEFGIWPDGLLDAYITMIPKVDGDATPLGQRPLSVLPVVHRIWASAGMVQLEPWFRSWVPPCVFSAGGGRSSVQAWFTTALDIEEVLSGIVEGDVHIFVADSYFEFHSLVRLRFKLAAGLGQPWTRDGGIPQGCSLSMMFIVALYLPWCRYLASQEGVQPQLYADNLKCVSRDPGVLLRAARFTTGYVRLVGQEPAPSKCIFLSTSRVVRREMRDWVVTDEGDRWTVKLDVRDLGGHLDTTFRGWSSTLATRVRVAIARLVVVFALPLHFHGRLGVLRSMFIPGALHGIEASFLAESSVRKLRSAFCRVAWSRRQPIAHVGAVLSLLDGPVGCDPAFCVVWFRFRQMRRYLAFRPEEAPRVYRLLHAAADGSSGHGPAHLLLESAAEIGFSWCSFVPGWVRPGLPVLSMVAGPVQHFRSAILDAWRHKVSMDLCARKGFRGGPFLDVSGTLQLLNSDHVRERDKALLRGVLVGGVWNGFLLGKVRNCHVPCRFCGAPDNDGHLFWLVLCSIFGLPFLMLGVIKFPWICVLGRVFGVALFWMFLAPCSSLTLTMFGREIRHCFEVCLLGEFGMVFYWGRLGIVMSLVGFVVGMIMMGTYFGSALFHLWLRFVKILNSTNLWRWISLFGLGACFGMGGCLYSLVPIWVLLGLVISLRVLVICWKVLWVLTPLLLCLIGGCLWVLMLNLLLFRLL